MFDFIAVEPIHLKRIEDKMLVTINRVMLFAVLIAAVTGKILRGKNELL